MFVHFKETMLLSLLWHFVQEGACGKDKSKIPDAVEVQCGEVNRNYSVLKTLKNDAGMLVLKVLDTNIDPNVTHPSLTGKSGPIVLKIAIEKFSGARLRNEINVLTELGAFSDIRVHPNLPQAYFCGTTATFTVEGQPCVVMGMECFDMDLVEYQGKMNEKGTSPEKMEQHKLKVLKQQFEFGKFLQSMNVVYRDFKNENCALYETAPDTIYVIDFDAAYGSKQYFVAIFAPAAKKFMTTQPSTYNSSTKPVAKDDGENLCYLTVYEVNNHSVPWDKPGPKNEKDTDAIFDCIIQNFKGIYEPLAAPLATLLQHCRNRDKGSEITVNYDPVISILAEILHSIQI